MKPPCPDRNSDFRMLLLFPILFVTPDRIVFLAKAVDYFVFVISNRSEFSTAKPEKFEWSSLLRKNQTGVVGRLLPIPGSSCQVE